MSKKKKQDEVINEEIKEEVIEEKKKEVKVNVDREPLIDEFLEDNEKTKGKYNTYAAGFKAWWTVNEGKSLGERHSFEEWQEYFEKFLKTPVK